MSEAQVVLLSCEAGAVEVRLHSSGEYMLATRRASEGTMHQAIRGHVGNGADPTPVAAQTSLDVVRIGSLVLTPRTRAVTVEDRSVKLSAKEWSLLRVLASDPTRVFTKQELLREVWGIENGAKTRTLDSHASRLRRKLDPESTQFVITCWGVGYRLTESVPQ